MRHVFSSTLTQSGVNVNTNQHIGDVSSILSEARQFPFKVF